MPDAKERRMVFSYGSHQRASSNASVEWGPADRRQLRAGSSVLKRATGVVQINPA
jgi:hypothetical protein